jgi:hypothetical protein
MRSEMGAWLRTGCGLTAVVACLAIGGCGGDGASRSEQAAVRQLVPGAEQIGCHRVDAATTRCEAVSGNSLAGAKWTCELVLEPHPPPEAYSGSQSCWTSPRD